LYYLTAIFQLVFGQSDFSVRLFPAVCGIGLVALAWPLRPLIGRESALVYALLAAFSPTLAYYSRSLRHDVPMAFFTLAGVIAFLRFVETRRARTAYVAGAFAGLAFATKEDVYLTAFLLANALWMLALWDSGSGRAIDRARDWFGAIGRCAREAWQPITTGVLIAVTLGLWLYTSLFSHPENWNAVDRAIRYWWGQHEQQRIGGPWWYYLPLELFYEPVTFFAALAALIEWRGFRAPTRAHAFFLVWAVSSFAIYAWAQEKVPWLLVPFLVPQTIVAASFLAADLPRRAIAGVPLLVYGIWSLIACCYLYDAPRTDEPPNMVHAEPMVYVQSTYDIHRVKAQIDDATRKLGTGTETSMVVVGDATWPLSWYLRRHSVRWGSLPPETNAPILVVDPPDASRLERDLAATYDMHRFAVRGWWQPDWQKATLSNVLRFLGFRLAWNGVGTTDAVLFVAKDLTPGKPRPTVRLTPAPPTVKYRGGAETLAARSIFGAPGSGLGELNEPRQLAFAPDGSILVADSKNNRIQRFDASGRALATYGGPDPSDARGSFRDPCGVAVGSDGSIYVADTWNHRIQKLDHNGGFVREWREESPSLWGPRAILVTPGGEVVVSDTGNKRILVYDGEGKRLHVFGSEGSNDGQFVEPVGLAFDPSSETLFVADTGNHRVQRLGLDGTFRGKWTATGWEEFYSEPYLWWHAGNLWATDSFNHRVNLYDGSTGALRRSIGATSDGLTFKRPVGVGVSGTGEAYVADTMNHRIVVLGEALPAPAAATVRPDGAR
ncbi:MAG: flippase activity-associated protein Agl23, partial [Candidatus Binatia bacterium]